MYIELKDLQEAANIVKTLCDAFSGIHIDIEPGELPQQNYASNLINDLMKTSKLINEGVKAILHESGISSSESQQKVVIEMSDKEVFVILKDRHNPQ